MSTSNNQIGRIHRRDIEKKLKELEVMTLKLVLMSDSKEEIFSVGISMLTKAKQILLPIVGIDKLEMMFDEYIKTIRARGS